MIIMLSGEGVTDLGKQEWDSHEKKYVNNFGPAGAILKGCVEKESDSHQEKEYVFIDKNTLQKEAMNAKKFLPGKRDDKEKGYFIKQARALGQLALNREKESQRKNVIAVLFHDSDLSHSASRTVWQDKFDSIVKGFESAPFDKGVPMVPKPTSEAWLLALLEPPLTKCSKLEDKKDRDALKKSLKDKLKDINIEMDDLSRWISEGHPSITLKNLSSMSSYKKFGNSLKKACEKIIE